MTVFDKDELYLAGQKKKKKSEYDAAMDPQK